MPAITIQTNGQADTDMKEYVGVKLGISTTPSNAQVTAYWRQRVADEIKGYLQHKAERIAAAAVTDPNIT